MKKIPFVDLQTQYQNLKPEIDKAIQEVLNVGHFILGEEVNKFEEEFASFCETKYCVGVDNGTSALTLGLKALGIGHGNEVITPVNSYIASSSTISLTGATPVWIDCEPDTYNINVTKIEKKITKKTKAIMPVHLYGQSADMDAILSLAKKYNLFVIEDACQGHGAKYKGKKVGSFGDVAAFSFYPGKNLGAYGDAGAITTNNKTTYELLLMMRNYGQSKKYYHDFLAGNNRLDNIHAAVLRVKLRSLDTWNKLRNKHASLYTRLLREIPVVTPFEDEHAFHVYHLYVIQTSRRDELKDYLAKKGIETGIHYPIPIHKQQAYQVITKNALHFPVTEEFAPKILSLPMYPELTDDQIKYICSEIKKFFS